MEVAHEIKSRWSFGVTPCSHRGRGWVTRCHTFGVKFSCQIECSPVRHTSYRCSSSSSSNSSNRWDRLPFAKSRVLCEQGVKGQQGVDTASSPKVSCLQGSGVSRDVNAPRPRRTFRESSSVRRTGLDAHVLFSLSRRLPFVTKESKSLANLDTRL